MVKRLEKRVSWFESFIGPSSLFLSRELCGSSPSLYLVAATVHHRTAFISALTINMHIAPPVVIATPKIHTRPRHHHRAAVTSTYVTHASRQDRQQRDPEPNLNSVNWIVRLIHADLPFAEEIKKCGCSRNTTHPAPAWSALMWHAMVVVFIPNLQFTLFGGAAAASREAIAPQQR